jgi:lipoyl(octanoyl) transferase
MEWKISHGLTEYSAALETMAARVAAIQAGQAEELVWLVEHPPLYTLGTSAKATDILTGDIPSFETGRGGQVTYHGPGQRVVYLMLDLRKRAALQDAQPDLRAYVQQLEQWIILTLAQFGIEGFTREGRVGVWVDSVVSRQSPVASGRVERVAGGEPRAAGASAIGAIPLQLNGNEAKIAALGVRVQKWVTSHGIALNVNPDLSHYAGIVPCGIREFGVTSLHALGVRATMDAVNDALKQCFAKVFDV